MTEHQSRDSGTTHVGYGWAVTGLALTRHLVPGAISPKEQLAVMGACPFDGLVPRRRLADATEWILPSFSHDE